MLWQEEPTPRRLKDDVAEVAFAMENAPYEMRHFLDLETGEVAFDCKKGWDGKHLTAIMGTG